MVEDPVLCPFRRYDNRNAKRDLRWLALGPVFCSTAKILSPHKMRDQYPRSRPETCADYHRQRQSGNRAPVDLARIVPVSKGIILEPRLKKADLGRVAGRSAPVFRNHSHAEDARGAFGRKLQNSEAHEAPPELP